MNRRSIDVIETRFVHSTAKYACPTNCMCVCVCVCGADVSRTAVGAGGRGNWATPAADGVQAVMPCQCLSALQACCIACRKTHTNCRRTCLQTRCSGMLRPALLPWCLLTLLGLFWHYT